MLHILDKSEMKIKKEDLIDEHWSDIFLDEYFTINFTTTKF